MYSPSHRPSMSTPNVATPPSPRLRRMSSPVPPPAPLDLPEPIPHYALSQPNPSRSPLRNGVTLNPATGALSEDGSSDTDASEPWGTRERDRDQISHSPPSPSISKFASSFAQRVGSLVTSVSPGSQHSHMPTDAELEAEAESQRERSRREAERILSREAVERKNVEERVLEMLESSRTHPTRSQTTPSPIPMPSPTKEGSWWSTAKNKLTPTKDKDLTPAQQIVQDTKAREKERRKGKEREWPSNGKGKYNDPALQQLTLPPGARPPGGQVGGGAKVPQSPSSPTPHSGRPPRQLTASPTAMTPSPSRSTTQGLLPSNPHHNNNSTPRNPGVQHSFPRPPTASPVPSGSSALDPPPIYAQFTSQGALDIPGTLLTIARRFEKLERWAVGHTRALEERMSDVEKWLVDKERERERETASLKPSNATTKPPPSSDKDSPAQQVVREVTIERKTIEVDQEVKRDVGEMKEELNELRGRVGELGREMARLASVSAESSPPSEAFGFGIGRIASPPASTPAPSPSPRALPSLPLHPTHTKSPSTHSIAQSETASIISTGTGASTRTKLPYPSGDYTSSSPPPASRSPPSAQNYSANNASSGISRTRPFSYSGLPIPQTSFPSTESTGISPRVRESPAPPVQTGNRKMSTSPSPRKRYTIALGQPLSSSSSPSASAASKEPPVLGLDEKQSDFGQPLFAEPQTAELHTAFFTEVHGEDENRTEEKDPDVEDHRDEDGEGDRKEGAQLGRQETIGKTPITLSRLSLSPPPSQDSSPSNRGNLRRSSPRHSPYNPRIRAQSTYGVPGSVSTTSVSSLGRTDGSPNDEKGSWRTRSRSIDRVGLGIDAVRGTSGFVDPLVVRKKDKDVTVPRSPAISSPGGPRGRVPFGDLLAFFDGDKPT